MSYVSYRLQRDFLAAAPSYQQKLRFSRAEIEAFNAHGWHCHYCGSQDNLTTDHIVSVARGGTDCIGNLIPACKTCNSSKRHVDYDTFKETIQAEIVGFIASNQGCVE